MRKYVDLEAALMGIEGSELNVRVAILETECAARLVMITRIQTIEEAAVTAISGTDATVALCHQLEDREESKKRELGLVSKLEDLTRENDILRMKLTEVLHNNTSEAPAKPLDPTLLFRQPFHEAVLVRKLALWTESLLLSSIDVDPNAPPPPNRQQLLDVEGKQLADISSYLGKYT